LVQGEVSRLNSNHTFKLIDRSQDYKEWL